MAYNDVQRGMRPLYPSVVSFPVACFVLTLSTDLAYWATDSFIWETASVWLLTIGLIVAVFAILAGIVDLARSRRLVGRDRPWLVVVFGHAIAFGLSVVNVLIHSRDGYTAVVPQGLIVSFIVVLVLLVTALLGRRALAAHGRATPGRIGGLA